MNEKLDSVLREINDLKDVLKLMIILNKEVLTIKEAALISGYKASYLYKLSSTRTDLPIYTACDNGKIFIKKDEWLKWMTKKKKNNVIQLQTEVEKYLTREAS